MKKLQLILSISLTTLRGIINHRFMKCPKITHYRSNRCFGAEQMSWKDSDTQSMRIGEVVW